MKYRADLHVHSRFSIATSRYSTLEEYSRWAGIKGIEVIGTGDFTHPGWMSEIRNKLIPDERIGFFRLKEEVGARTARVAFCLSSEISCIYKPPDEADRREDEKTYKVHLLIFVRKLESAEYLSKKLAELGNINADGRPILKLAPRDLLEIVLESGDGSFLIPAHIWTPWFSVLGEKSGFDSIEEAFGDLSNHIFAVETGLSSDPKMNWLVSALDKYTLVSNSDAHSPEKLGREVNLFDTEFSYDGMFDAIKTKDGFKGTVEYFPEEGKYFYDGHRRCGISMSPEEAEKSGGICPVCGKRLTFGVMHRVKTLADRSEPVRPAGSPEFFHAFPLKEMISLLVGRGINTKVVASEYKRIIDRFGNELDFLLETPLMDIRRYAGMDYANLIEKMRNDDLRLVPGFDGRFGQVVLE